MISLIFCGDLVYCPYIVRYIERFNLLESDYEVLFWNRSSYKIESDNRYKCYEKPSPESLSKRKKLIDFYGFRVWLKNQLDKTNPDGIIFLSTLSAVLLFDVANQYKNRYVFDIRDYSYENIGLFKHIEKKIINNSFFTSISSKGFKAFLPSHEYVIAHNFNRNERTQSYNFNKQKEPYHIVWNGTVRFFNYQKQYLDLFKNDSRFVLVYHGAGTDLEQYKAYCEENEIDNVVFTGAYDNAKKYELIKRAAFLNNCYGGLDGDELRFAISNRFYDGMVYHIPQIVESGGFKAKELSRLGLGLVVEPDSDLPDKLYNYYNTLAPSVFDFNCDNALDEILAEDNHYIESIDSFIKAIDMI